jgi:hypothetical protein
MIFRSVASFFLRTPVELTVRVYERRPGATTASVLMVAWVAYLVSLSAGAGLTIGFLVRTLVSAVQLALSL